jgi:hypothetical protein
MASSSLLHSPPPKHGAKVDVWEPSVNKDRKYHRKELFSLVSTFLLNQSPPKECYVHRQSGNVYFIRCSGSKGSGTCPFAVRCTICHTNNKLVTVSAYEPRHINCGAIRVTPSLEDLLLMNDLCSFAVKAKSLNAIIDFGRQHCTPRVEMSTVMASRLRSRLLNDVSTIFQYVRTINFIRNLQQCFLG